MSIYCQDTGVGERIVHDGGGCLAKLRWWCAGGETKVVYLILISYNDTIN